MTLGSARYPRSTSSFLTSCERPHVAPCVGRPTFDLLGAHVGDRALHRAGRSHPAVSRTRQPEIQELRDPVAGQDDVVGLDVTVNDAVLVRRGERTRDLHADVDRLVLRQRPPPQPLPQGLAVVGGHDDIESAVLGFGDLVDRADVGVVQRRRRPRLLHEPVAGLRVAPDLGRDELDRDGPAERDVARPVDHPHPAAADPVQDLVM
jgi:hypothetical protein